MRLVARGVAVVVLLAVVFGLCVHYDATFDDHSPYPAEDDLATDYETYVGEETLLFGDVLSVDASTRTATIRVSSDAGPFEVDVRGFTESVQPGGVVQVYGTLRYDQAIDAKNVEVVNPAGSSKRYKYGVSVVGALLVLAVFFSQWRFDRDTLGFEVRADG